MRPFSPISSNENNFDRPKKESEGGIRPRLISPIFEFSSFYEGSDINLRGIRGEKEKERGEMGNLEHSSRGGKGKKRIKRERERVAVAGGGSANRFKRIAVSHGPVTIVKTESTAIRF